MFLARALSQILAQQGAPYEIVRQLSSTVSLVPKEWPRLVQKIELHISIDRPLALCLAVLSIGATVSGLLWSSGFLLRAWTESKSDWRERTKASR